MPREIRVTATGNATKAPDQARIDFSLKADAATVEQALAEVDGYRLALRTVLIRDAGLAPECLVFMQVRVDPLVEIQKYKEGGESHKRSVIVGYRATESLSLKVANFRQNIGTAMRIVSTGTGLDDVRLRFEVADKETLIDQALAGAVAAAARQASIMARAAGVSLGTLLLIDRSSSRGVYSDSPTYMASDVCASPPPFENIEPDAVSASESITCVWEVT